MPRAVHDLGDALERADDAVDLRVPGVGDDEDGFHALADLSDSSRASLRGQYLASSIAK